jgi:hypothetical protein
MRPRRSHSRVGSTLTIALAVMLMSGCATTFKYSYDVRTKFPELKTYKWATAIGTIERDPLLETNVVVFTDRDLESKGLTRADSAALLVWMDYSAEFNKRYQLQTLTLNIARADNREMIWRGTAAGNIKTDAASKTLERLVTRILSSFPPK